MPKHVDVWIGDRGQHPIGHLGGGHPQLGVHTGDDHVEPFEQFLFLVDATVGKDVDLDPGKDAEWREFAVELGHQVQLPPQSLRGEAVGNGEAATGTTLSSVAVGSSYSPQEPRSRWK
ncbi:hypothetical protein GTS_42750 [Gandjariella thermophila]|uniref:Uncharacterized protein n=1 Tax=Gandjariella thermophila TaxID=1931992 RepID=A0A4D4JBC8_9PSEU|nr:hypothetical protein GTS_42750 [Gandjariella thermophila]